MAWQASFLTFGILGIAAAAAITTGIIIYYKYRKEKPHSDGSSETDQGTIITFDDLANENPSPKVELRYDEVHTKEIGSPLGPLAQRSFVETGTQTSGDILDFSNAQQSSDNRHQCTDSAVNASPSISILTINGSGSQGASSSPVSVQWKKRGCQVNCHHKEKDPSGFLRVKKSLLRQKKSMASNQSKPKTVNDTSQRSVVRSLPTGGNFTQFNIEPEAENNLSLSLNDLDDYDDDDDASVVTIGSDTQYPAWNEMPLEVKRSLKCKACLFRKVETVTYPCKHPYLCNNCAPIFFKDYNRCTVCRNLIKSFDPVLV